MTWKFDPSISSADYLALARKRARYCKYPKEMEWMLESKPPIWHTVVQIITTYAFFFDYCLEKGRKIV